MYWNRKLFISILLAVAIAGLSVYSVLKSDPLVLHSVVASSNDLTAFNIVLAPVAAGLGAASALALKARQESLLAYPNSGRMRVFAREIFRISAVLVISQGIALLIVTYMAASTGSEITPRAFAQVPLSFLHLFSFATFGLGCGTFLPFLLTPPILAAGLWCVAAFNILNLDAMFGYTIKPITEIGTTVLTTQGYGTYCMLFAFIFFAGAFLIASEIFQHQPLLWVSVLLIAAFVVLSNIMGRLHLFQASAGETRCVSVGVTDQTKLCIPVDQAHRTQEFAAEVSPIVAKLEELPSYREDHTLTLSLNLPAEGLMTIESDPAIIADTVITSYSQCAVEWNRDADPLPVIDDVADAEFQLRDILVKWVLDDDQVTSKEASNAFGAIQQCPPQQP